MMYSSTTPGEGYPGLGHEHDVVCIMSGDAHHMMCITHDVDEEVLNMGYPIMTSSAQVPYGNMPQW